MHALFPGIRNAVRAVKAFAASPVAPGLTAVAGTESLSITLLEGGPVLCLSKGRNRRCEPADNKGPYTALEVGIVPPVAESGKLWKRWAEVPGAFFELPVSQVIKWLRTEWAAYLVTRVLREMPEEFWTRQEDEQEEDE